VSLIKKHVQRGGISPSPGAERTDGFGEFCHGDISVGLFKEMWYAGRIPIPPEARLLELGCAEVDWSQPFKIRRPDVQITAVDQRHPGARPAADVMRRGNLLDRDLFPPAAFDVAIAISVVCHVGVGRYGDPTEPDGDQIVMRHVKRWLKPGGVFYLDVPYRPEGPSTAFRQYNEADLQARVIQDWTVLDRQVFPSSHPDGPYVALVLTP